MRKRFWILASLLALSLLAAVTAAALCGQGAPEAAEDPAPPDGYVLTGVDGEVGVFQDGELILRTNVRLDGLRQTDRALVEQGIRLDSYDEALMLLEDFGA